MNDTDYERLLGKILAHNLLLRALYTKWARESDRPRNEIRGIKGMIDSTREVAPPGSDFEHRVYEQIGVELAEFSEAVDTRLMNMGHVE
jgi:hypothetical protein